KNARKSRERGNDFLKSSEGETAFFHPFLPWRKERMPPAGQGHIFASGLQYECRRRKEYFFERRLRSVYPKAATTAYLTFCNG
ncbi:MAG TPA: hypothetical protein PKY19_02980, partial [Oscillospiraceae bacterium]|nr:hypothetical protein [Oscillospiraceae bacterium]